MILWCNINILQVTTQNTVLSRSGFIEGLILSHQERHSVPSLRANIEYFEYYEKTAQIKKQVKLPNRKKIIFQLVKGK